MMIFIGMLPESFHLKVGIFDISQLLFVLIGTEQICLSFYGQ